MVPDGRRPHTAHAAYPVVALFFPEPYELPVDGLRGKTCIFSHLVYLFLREFSRGGSLQPVISAFLTANSRIV
ncbi:hypothetical protein C6B29_23035 [Escherichia coli]|nr:hypothetical protein C6B29_23035 [Escherichia coli]RCC73886.1 hypothetical protein C6B19_23035 [Escherichia coli]RCF41227.1 hypothetical protein C6B25_23045 [Escherichia coli]